MNITRYKMGSIFNEIQQEANLDYAYTSGFCCATCMNEELTDDHGVDSKGIWLKWYSKGANKTTWASHDYFYIVHDVTEEQMTEILNILNKYFNVDFNGDMSKCIKIS